MKSYGRWDSSWDKDRIRDMLEDAAGIAREHKTSFCIYEDENSDIVLIAHEMVGHPRILICGVTPVMNDPTEEFNPGQMDRFPEKFWDNEAYHMTIDEMISRVYNLLVKGIIEYGHIEFLSGGRLQLTGALQDAVRLSEKYDKPFITGSGKQRDIMVAPMSEKSKFLASCSCVVTRSGFWSISDMHSDRMWNSMVNSRRGAYTFSLRDVSYAMNVLYMAIGYGTKSYGVIGDDKDICILKLESAFEDAARTSPHVKGKCRVGITEHGEITVNFRTKSQKILKGESLEANPEFLDGDVLLREKITAAAKDAYERFSQVHNE